MVFRRGSLPPVLLLLSRVLTLLFDNPVDSTDPQSTASPPTVLYSPPSCLPMPSFLAVRTASSISPSLTTLPSFRDVRRTRYVLPLLLFLSTPSLSSKTNGKLMFSLERRASKVSLSTRRTRGFTLSSSRRCFRTRMSPTSSHFRTPACALFPLPSLPPSYRLTLRYKQARLRYLDAVVAGPCRGGGHSSPLFLNSTY